MKAKNKWLQFQSPVLVNSLYPRSMFASVFLTLNEKHESWNRLREFPFSICLAFP